MKLVIFFILVLSGGVGFSQESEELKRVHPCNFLVSLFQLELKCGSIVDHRFIVDGGCISDTTKFYSTWLNGKSRPREGFEIEYAVSELENANRTFSDSSFYLTRYDHSWEDSLGQAYIDTADFEVLEAIAEKYYEADYSNINNRIYVDYSIPIVGNTKQIAVKTTRCALLFTITLPENLEAVCIYDQATEERFAEIMRGILSINYNSDYSGITYKVISD